MFPFFNKPSDRRSMHYRRAVPSDCELPVTNSQGEGALDGGRADEIPQRKGCAERLVCPRDAEALERRHAPLVLRDALRGWRR